MDEKYMTYMIVYFLPLQETCKLFEYPPDRSLTSDHAVALAKLPQTPCHIPHDLLGRSDDHPEVSFRLEAYPGQDKDRFFPMKRGGESDVVRDMREGQGIDVDEHVKRARGDGTR